MRRCHILLCYPERLCDLLSVLRVLFGEGPEKAEAAGDHHVAVGHREVRAESATAQFSALGAGHRDNLPLRLPISVLARCSVGVESAVALRVKDVFVRKRSAKQAL